MDGIECKPKTIVADMAFRTDAFATAYVQHRIKYIASGARTPRPIRAETAVQLFKTPCYILADDLGKGARLKMDMFAQS